MNSSFGIWVKHRRKSLDLTQQELAQRVGCSLSLIFKIESDERRPSRQVVDLLAQHLEIPLEQRTSFLKAARQGKAVDELELSTPLSQPEPVPAPPPLRPDLPTPLTSFVGREGELRLILQQMRDPACRLLTLTGPGGAGKSRLALEAARQLQTEFQHGASFASLTGVNAPELVISAIANALGFVFSGTTGLKAQLFSFLKEKQGLLVLDALEHLLESIELLDEILEHAPDIKLLTTSREPLNLRAEWVFEVQGLPVPSDLDADRLESNNAAALFLQPRKTGEDSLRSYCRRPSGDRTHLPVGRWAAAGHRACCSVGEHTSAPHDRRGDRAQLEFSSHDQTGHPPAASFHAGCI